MKLILLGCFAAMLASCLAGGSVSHKRSPDALEYFSKDEIERGKAYHHAGYTLFFLRNGAVAAVLLLLIYTGAARGIEKQVSAQVSSSPLQVLLYFAVFFAIYTAVRFPFSLYGSFFVEHKYGFSNQGFAAWLGDFLKGSAISGVLWAVLAVGMYWLLKASPRLWWLFATGGFALFVAFLILLKPVVFDPVFNKFVPLQDAQLKTEIVDLAKKAGIEVGDVLVMDASRRTSHTNAYFTGFGHTKRIVLYDTLIEGHTGPEILSVMAHEIGHWKYAHIYKGYFMGVAGTLLVLLVISFLGGWLIAHMPLGAKTLASPATMPLVFLILFVCTLLSMPFQNVISRHFERQADGTSLELTGDPQTFIELQVKLSRANASDVTPAAFCYYWFYTHPSPMERIAAAEQFRGR